MDKPLKSVMHGQCDARPTVTSPAAGHHRPLTGAELYCSVTEAHVCEQLAQGCYLKAERPGVEPATFSILSDRFSHHAVLQHLRLVLYLLHAVLFNFCLADSYGISENR